MSPTPAKRPYSATVPEPFTGEPFQGTTIVVIHPGSAYLRLGRASDVLPVTIPHVIARRKRRSDLPHYEDPMLPGVDSQDKTPGLLDQGIELAEDMMWACKTDTGSPWKQTLPEQTIAFNLRSQRSILDEDSGVHWVNPSPQNPEVIVGEEALYLKPNSGYNIHWPMRRGQLNLHSGVGGSISSVVTDLETIWTRAIQGYLEIPPKDLKHYRAVLIVPDAYNKWHVRELVNLLLTNMGFSAVFVQQEAVCAIFGAGVCTACVVDVGDQKTAVTCVEDGIVTPNTRLCYSYGGSDITLAFYEMLRKYKFPYRECDPRSRMDAMFLQNLKEQFCHMDLDNCKLQTQVFKVKHPQQKIWEYFLKLGDECVMAPLGVFAPELLGIVATATAAVQRQARFYADAHDPFDGDYLEQVQRRRGMKDTGGDATKQDADPADDPSISQSQLEDDIANDDQSNLGSVTREAPEEQGGGEVEKVEEEQEQEQVLALDQAIVRSIERCDSEDLKRKMLNTILVIGGGVMFQGVQQWLNYRLSALLPPKYRQEPRDIMTEPKEGDPRTTSWKGAAVMACLDTAQELWIGRKEWQHFGYRLLRERASFLIE
ncbi:PREDICTED: actin-related protein 8-like [Priapulus caudatus]|uniref:Actin-related protein 8-like n=1 Tax=Priapulus caudatus TaxID=37621 RepID=A0ABM1EX70_PRICU|nr:PREDICTED: actin-related protein 8-like [Priapulus caudatus]